MEDQTTAVTEPLTTETEDWRSEIPEEIRDSASLVDITSVPELAKSFVNAQAMIGKKRVAVPTKNASDEEKAEFFKMLGRPDTPDEYQMPSEGVSKDIEDLFNEGGSLSEFRTEAHRLGLNSDQVAGLFRWYSDQSDKANQKVSSDRQTEHEQWMNDLKTELGNSFDQKADLARQAIHAFGDDELKDILNTTGLGNHPALVRWASKDGQALASDEIIGEGGAKPGNRLRPADAQAAIRAKNLDPEFQKAYMDDRHPSHNDAVREMADLYQEANPETDPTKGLTQAVTSAITG